MTAVHILAIDLAKRSFQVCATDRGGAVLFNRVLSRTRLQQLLSEQSPCIVAMEACATSHFWGRFAQNCDHSVRLIPPIYVKPFVKRQKNDAADAAAIAEAALRPNMHYVEVKSAEHQARAVAFRTHQCFVRFTLPGYSLYAAMKAGVEVLSRFLAVELGGRRIRVNAIAPGAIATDFGGGAVRDNEGVNAYVAQGIALGRVGVPDDVGSAVAAILSDDMAWANGTTFDISGGQLL